MSGFNGKVRNAVTALAVVVGLCSTARALALTPAGGTAQIPVAHTGAGDQGYSGFCWAYALTGLIESQVLKQPPIGLARVVDLSPEYLGFYHMYFEIQHHLGWFHVIVSRLTSGGGLEHADGTVEDIYDRVMVRNQFFRPDEGNNEPIALKELAKIGIVPRNVFDVKLNAHDEEQLTARIKDFIKNTLLVEDNLVQFEDVDENGMNETLFKKFVDIFGFEPPRPDQGSAFIYDNQVFSPQSFLRDYLHFEPIDFFQVSVTSANQELAIQAVAQALNAGFAVPIGIPIYRDKNSEGKQFQKQAEADFDFSTAHCPNGICRYLNGSHEMLLVNWTGDMSTGLVKEFIAKNSWGADDGRNDMGQVSDDPNATGFYLIEADFLRQTQFTAPKKDLWDVVLPIAFYGEFYPHRAP